MRLLAGLALVTGPAVAVTYVAIHQGATGIENGVLWAIGLVAVLVAVGVVAAAVERAWYS